MREDQSVSEMATEALARQAAVRAERTREPLEEALEAVLRTEAGRRLGRLRDGEHRDERADRWQLPCRASGPRSVGKADWRRADGFEKKSAAEPAGPSGS